MQTDGRPGIRPYLRISWMAVKLYEKMFADIIRERGITPNEKDVLLFLCNYPELDTASDIVAYRSISKSLVSKSVDSLCRRGLLESWQDGRDRRITHLRVAPAAAETLAELQAVQRRFLAILGEDLSREERESLMGLLGKIARNIERHVPAGHSGGPDREE